MTMNLIQANLEIVVTVAVALMLVIFALGTLRIASPSKRKARKLRRTTPIHVILEQAEQGMAPLIHDGPYIYRMVMDATCDGCFCLVNPHTHRVFRVGAHANTTEFLRNWGYRDRWPTGKAQKATLSGKITAVR